MRLSNIYDDISKKIAKSYTLHSTSFFYQIKHYFETSILSIMWKILSLDWKVFISVRFCIESYKERMCKSLSQRNRKWKKHFKETKTFIYKFMLDQAKLSRVPSWIGHCHLLHGGGGSLEITLTVHLTEEKLKKKIPISPISYLKT